MTPAAALSQAALEATPAYAETTTDELGSETNPDSLAAWGNLDDAGTVRVTKAELKEARTYDGQSHTLTSADFEVTISNTPADGEATYYKLTGANMFTIAKAADEAGLTPATGGFSFSNADDHYDFTVTLNGGEERTESGNFFFVVDPYPIPQDKIVLAPAQVGVTAADDLETKTVELCDSMLFNNVKVGDVLTVDYDKKAVTGTYETVDDKKVFTKVGTTPVEIGIKTEAPASNYTLADAATEGPDAGKITKNADVVADNEYNLVFGTPTFGAELDNPTTSASASFSATSGTGTETPLCAVTSVFTSPTTKTIGVVATDAYKVTWAQGGKAIEASAKPELPGVYTATAQVGGEKGKPASGTLTLTVKGDLREIGVEGKGVTAEMGGVNVGSDGLNASGKAFFVKKADTTEGIAENIAKALTVTFTDQNGKEQVVKGTDLDVSVKNTESEGVAAIGASPANSNIYLGTFNLSYQFGKELPKAQLKVDGGVLPWATSTGYDPKDLIEFVDEDGDVLATQPTEGGDYTVEVTYVGADGKVKPVEGNMVNVDDYTLTVTPKGEYAGDPQTFKVSVQPVQVDEKNAKVSWPTLMGTDAEPWMAFNGKAAQPIPSYVVTWKHPITKDLLTDTVTPEVETKDTLATEPIVSYAGNEGVGTATATTTFRGNFKGSLSDTFEIRQASLAGSNVTVAGQTQLASDFDGAVLNPTVKIGDVTLEEGVDFEVVEGSVAKSGTNTNGGSDYTFSVKGIGNYTGTNTTGTFATTDQDINDEWDFAVEEGTYLYDLGKEVKAKVQVTTKPVQGATEGTLVGKFDADQADYTLTYENDTNAGTATVTVTGVGAYAGSKTLTYEIAPLEISADSEADVVLDVPEGGFVYAPGIKAEPAVVVAKSSITPVNETYDGDAIPLKDIVDQIGFKWANNDKAGTAQAVVYGKGGNIVGEYAENFDIAKADITKAAVEAVAVAPGAPASDAVKVTLGETALVAGTDYTVAAAEGATVPGKVAVTVTGAGNYAGEVKKDVEVLYDVEKAQVAIEDAVYNGSRQDPKVEVSYTSGGKKVVVDPKAYDVKVDGNATDAGSYKVTVAGDEAAGWTSEASATYTIAKAQGPKTAEVTYTAAGAYKVTVPGLTEDKDFKVTPNPAQGKLAITYMGNYTGSTTVDYVPAAKPVTPAPDQPAAGKTGWVGSGNDWAYYENGQAVKGGWKLIGGEWYHFEKSGKMTNTKWFQD
ncbi:hypothetical protein GMI70_04625, partial [Eggerthellaceae bacterium zg-893]|nr:hypothetical protein [Eggerthellaceae bacterium zg-893]